MNLRNTKGFSLIELMVVMAIISALTVIGMVSVKSTGDTRNLQSAVYELSVLTNMARDAAVTHNTTAYLLVNNDSSDGDKFCRYAVVIYKNVDEDGTVTWNMDQKGQYMPRGIFFDGLSSQKVSTASVVPEIVQFDIKTMSMGMGSSWNAYEFTPNGTCSQAGVGLILTAGIMNNNVLSSPNKNLYDGFILQRLGSVVYFQNTAQLLDALH